jgi:hypothetical protein
LIKRRGVPAELRIGAQPRDRRIVLPVQQVALAVSNTNPQKA